MYTGIFIKPHIQRLVYERTEFLGYYANFINSFSHMSLEEFKFIMSTCTTCKARGEARQVVIPEGSIDSDTVFVGRNPGETEDIQCRPFYPTATAGSWFMKYLENLQVDRENIYITNALQCHTRKDRPPITSELQWCSAWKCLEFMRLKNMKYLFLLGLDALRQTMGYEIQSIARIFGDVYQVKYNNRNLLVFPCFHPAAVWRNAEMARQQFSYLQAARQIIDADREGRLKWLI